MNKSLHIALLTLIAILLSVILAVSLINKDDYILFDYDEKIIFEDEYGSDNIDSLNVKSISADINIRKSESDKIKVIVYGNKRSNILSEVKGNTLTINNDNKIGFCIGFCIRSSKIEITVPESIYEEFELKTVSGDISISNVYVNNAEINSTSGDIIFYNINKGKIKTISGDIKGQDVSEIKVNTVSGEVYMKNINSSCNIKTTSGEVNIPNLIINNNSYITTISGDVEINKINDIYINTSTTSGDVKINQNNRHADKELQIKTISGDIEVSERN